MSEIDKWDIVTISEIATDIYIGSEITNNQLGTGNYPAIKCGDVNSGLPLHFTECISFVNPDLISRKKYFETGDLLVGKVGNKETAGKAVAYLGKEKCLLGDSVYAIKHKQNPKYLAYMLSTSFVRTQIYQLNKTTTVFVCFIREIKKLQIPLPPLEEQERIVSMLDKANSRIKELNECAESLITDRNHQFNFLIKQIFLKSNYKNVLTTNF